MRGGGGDEGMWSFRNQNTRKNEKEKGDAVFEQNMGGGERLIK